MKFLVQMVANELFPALEPPAAAGVVRKMVFPSLDLLAQWNSEGKISGGVCLGQRAVSFIAEAPDSTALDGMVRQLPLWLMTRTSVTPLVEFGERKRTEEQALKQAGL